MLSYKFSLKKRNFFKKSFKLFAFIIPSIFFPFVIYNNSRNTGSKKIYKKKFSKIWILKISDN